ncbi:hypothetical protein B0H15DRAFT_867685 [Mycena belliarum]|uniref:Secreted protein n=1 Tax=Mycena belliarum TaxID=1033014 RepID=A0AAD6TNW2_9AGAR|nr:hypothetical protein B0H15DRAFT_867685 [Mycena belliae]
MTRLFLLLPLLSTLAPVRARASARALCSCLSRHLLVRSSRTFISSRLPSARSRRDSEADYRIDRGKVVLRLARSRGCIRTLHVGRMRHRSRRPQL